MHARECVQRALQEIRKLQNLLTTNNIPPAPPPREEASRVKEIPGWNPHQKSYANLQNVYSTKVDGKSIHAFPFHDLEDTKKFVGELKKCEGFTVKPPYQYILCP
jgi:hypothetical protein